MSIAFDIPIITIRNIGYTIPVILPKHFSSTEILNRKNKILVAKSNLETITTLDKAVRVLFAKSLVYHHEILLKCTTEIIATVLNEGLRTKHHFKYLYEEYISGKISMDANRLQKGHTTWNMNSTKFSRS